jgi:hypothetical protein
MAIYWHEDFEGTLSSWTDYSLGHNSTISTDEAYTGSKSLKMPYPNGGFIDRFLGSTNKQFNLRFAIKLSSNWVTDSVASKIIYIRCDQSTGPYPNGVLEMIFGGRGLIFALQGAYDSTDSENIPMNITLNSSWQEIEWKWFLNDPGIANGSMTCWLKQGGVWVQTAHYANRQYRGPNPGTTASDGQNNGSNNFVNNVRNYMQFGTGTIYLDNYTVANSRIGTGGEEQPPVTGGLLQGSRSTPTFPVNLSSVGLTDWIKWGRVATSSVDRKSGANVLNSTLTNIGGGSYFQYTSALSTYSWSGGTPTATASGVTGSLMTQASSAGPGFQLIVPADTTQRTLKFYGTLYGVSARLTATLSDSSAAAFSDTITATTTAVPVVYTLTYKAGSASQSVTLKWEATAATENPGNLTWHAVTLTNDGTTLQAPTISSFTPTSGLVGSSVTITGTNFDALTTNNTVAFNGTTATVSSATTTSLVVTVPSGATTGTITVTTAGGTATSSGSYTVDSPPTPETPPESGQGGSAMMILMMP